MIGKLGFLGLRSESKGVGRGHFLAGGGRVEGQIRQVVLVPGAVRATHDNDRVRLFADLSQPQ